jgi:hypothetical protein
VTSWTVATAATAAAAAAAAAGTAAAARTATTPAARTATAAAAGTATTPAAGTATAAAAGTTAARAARAASARAAARAFGTRTTPAPITSTIATLSAIGSSRCPGHHPSGTAARNLAAGATWRRPVATAVAGATAPTSVPPPAAAGSARPIARRAPLAAAASLGSSAVLSVAAATPALSPPPAALPAVVTAPLLGARRQIRHVVVVACLARAGRRVLPLQHADEAHVVHTILHRVERLEQTSQAVALDPEARLDLSAGRRIGRPGRLVDDRRRRCHHGSIALGSRRRVGRATFGRRCRLGRAAFERSTRRICRFIRRDRRWRRGRTAFRLIGRRPRRRFRLRDGLGRRFHRRPRRLGIGRDGLFRCESRLERLARGRLRGLAGGGCLHRRRFRLSPIRRLDRRWGPNRTMRPTDPGRLAQHRTRKLRDRFHVVTAPEPDIS